MDSKDIPLKLFLNILRARRFDLYAESHDSFEHQTDYLKKIFSSLFEISLRANLNTINETSLTCVRDFGFSYGVANLFLSLNKLEDLGKKPMYIESKSIKRVDNSLDLDEQYLQAIKELAASASKTLSSGRLNLRRCDDRVLPVLYCASMVSKVLRIVERKPDIVKTDKFQISAFSKIINLLIARVRKYL